jgi:malate synthase
VRHSAHLTNGQAVTQAFVASIIAEEMEVKNLKGGKFDLAAELFGRLMTGPEFPEFLTLVAYEHLE